MVVTERGMVKVARLLQPMNAENPIVATASPMMTEVRPLQSAKALLYRGDGVADGDGIQAVAV